MIKQTEGWKELAETLGAESGYVLIVYRTPFKSSEVRGRYTRSIVEEAKKRIEQWDDVQRVVIEEAFEFQARAEQKRKCPRDDWGFAVNVMQFPLVDWLPKVEPAE
jgi:hypothetical protein